MFSTLPVLVSLLIAPIADGELASYVRRPDDSFGYTVAEPTDLVYRLKMTSQTWHGAKWVHDLAYVLPPKLVAKGTGVLIVTGGNWDARDIAVAKTIARTSGLPVGVLFQVPNQPLWEKTEDALIAYSFQKFLETGDSTWPLLLPMTKSVAQAMSVLEAATKTLDNPVRKFVITGMSKRGWTTWLAGAIGDPRVVGIAPAVFDFVNFPAQLAGQIREWGKFSEMIHDYTDKGLQEVVGSDPGKALISIVDPFAYRSNIKVPTLIVTGGNDRYWTVNALDHYWNKLPQPKWHLKIPNVGHDLGGGREAYATIAAFAASCAGVFEMPKPSFEFADEFVRLDPGSTGFLSMSVWAAESDTRDFRDAKWVDATLRRPQFEQEDPDPNNPPKPMARYTKSERNQAVFVEARYKIGEFSFSLCSTVRINPKPAQDRSPRRLRSESLLAH